MSNNVPFNRSFYQYLILKSTHVRLLYSYAPMLRTISVCSFFFQNQHSVVPAEGVLCGVQLSCWFPDEPYTEVQFVLEFYFVIYN